MTTPFHGMGELCVTLGAEIVTQRKTVSIFTVGQEVPSNVEAHEIFTATVHVVVSTRRDRPCGPVVYWSEFLAANPEVPGSIPGANRLSE
jgi:hypothetical protein